MCCAIRLGSPVSALFGVLRVVGLPSQTPTDRQGTSALPRSARSKSLSPGHSQEIVEVCVGFWPQLPSGINVGQLPSLKFRACACLHVCTRLHLTPPALKTSLHQRRPCGLEWAPLPMNSNSFVIAELNLIHAATDMRVLRIGVPEMNLKKSVAARRQRYLHVFIDRSAYIHTACAHPTYAGMPPCYVCFTQLDDANISSSAPRWANTS